MNSTELNNLIDSKLLVAVGDAQARPYLEQISHVYSDLDGTLFAPGGRLLADHAGEPSTATAEALVALKRANIEVIAVTGRSGLEAGEHMRVLNLNTYISEVGCMIQRGVRAQAQISYELGAWSDAVLAEDVRCDGEDGADMGAGARVGAEVGALPVGELPPGVTPYELMLRSGVLERLEAAFAGKLESLHGLIDPRVVTHAFQGFIDLDAAAALLAKERLPMQLIDNGQIHPPKHKLVDCPEIHIYHLMPKGTSKAHGVAADIGTRGLDAARCLAIGDSVEDLGVASSVGTMVIMGNALRSPIVQSALVERADKGEATLYTRASTADGWVEFARALLAAKQLNG